MPKKKQVAREIALDLIEKPQTQLRTKELVDEERIRELAVSIKANGLIEPVVVHQVNGRFRLIAGWRRMMAHIKLGREKILAVVVEATDKEAAKMRFAENQDRDDVHPLDLALHLKEMIDLFECSQKELAEQIGKSEAFISQHLGLLGGFECVKMALLEGKITFNIARELNHFKTEKAAEFHLFHAIRSGANAELIKRWRLDAENFSDENEDQGDEHKEPEVTEQQLRKYVCEACRQAYDFRTITIMRICPDCTKIITDGGE